MIDKRILLKIKAQVVSILKNIQMHERRFAAIVFAISIIGFCHRVSLNQMGRKSAEVVGGKMKHQLKRFYRLMSNEKFECDEMWESYLRWLFSINLRHSNRIILIIDWTDFKFAKVLRLTTPLMGRSVVLYQKGIQLKKNKEMLFEGVKLNGKEIRSQNEFEMEFVREFLNYLEGFGNILKGKEFIIIGDRGFGYAEYFEFIQKILKEEAYKKLKKHIKLDYILRMKADTFIHFQGMLPEGVRVNKEKLTKESKIKKKQYSIPCGVLDVKENSSRFIGKIFYRKDKKIECNLALSHKHISGHTKEENTWRLVTSLNDLDLIMKGFSRRMEIEESFKDTKGANDGLQIKTLNFKELQRINRYLFCIGVATFSLLVLGLHVQRNPEWAEKIATKDKRTFTGYSLSIFSLARQTLQNLKEPFFCSFDYFKLYFLWG